MLKEFKEFATRGNVLDMAVGIIIGAAFTTIVSSLVDDILMPPLGLVLGELDFSNLFVTLGGGEFASLAAAREAGAPVIAYGLFINAVIKFLLVAFALFILIKQFNRFKKQADAAPASPPAEEVLLTEIRDLLKQQRG
ncbi:large conductance mechanosensitive channel protein MscL [Pseudofulvimonas gallinarii]|uniref:Large-conductance mechanosensitive channel n=1 Tax=Pseudofulvimonas gallinarii TaxID=634155 RepID=A0A4S3KXL0_9GAMM|nr:large conductance mechanosensitive channel protein MscL [Pseudofulvimonas gallinarii]TCS93179.1 large conductance mechanosensitive channel [Pseudofulvimonas gallinarii]THD14062.1 large-conductance mechanosensitive channel protein [Pseudofulvimonas gallinarii]